MAQPQKHPLRPLRVQEECELRRIVKASSERVDVARRARALLAEVQRPPEREVDQTATW